MSKRNQLLIIVGILVITGILNEWGWKLVNPTIIHSVGVHDNGVKYDIYLIDTVYYFINSIFTLLWPLSLFYVLFLFRRRWAAVRTFSTIPVFWFTVEVIENYCFLMKINNDVLKIISDGGVWQISFTILMSSFVLLGLIRFKS